MSTLRRLSQQLLSSRNNSSPSLLDSQSFIHYITCHITSLVRACLT